MSPDISGELTDIYKQLLNLNSELKQLNKVNKEILAELKLIGETMPIGGHLI